MIPEWSHLEEVQPGGNSQARAAQENLWQTHWHPLDACVRRQGTLLTDEHKHE